MNTPLRALIVEDEPAARSALRNLLRLYFPQVQVVAEAADAPAAQEALAQHQPNLLFVDINLPGASGLEFIKFSDTQQRAVVLTTAWSGFALEAYGEGALGYLLKPVDRTELAQVLERVQALLDGWAAQAVPRVQAENSDDTLAVHQLGETRWLPLRQIVWAEADGSYTHLMLEDGRRETLSRNLAEVVRHLPCPPFVLVHRSFAVNARFVRCFDHTGHKLCLSTGQNLPVARRRKNEVMAALRM